jgi:redox-sensitive bicupin YhaK (pirin superfamily)
MNKKTRQPAIIMTAHNTSDGDGVKLIMNSQEKIDQTYRDYRDGVLTL